MHTETSDAHSVLERDAVSGYLRRAGWAAIVAAGSFLIQPLSVAFLPFDLQEVRDPLELTDYWWAGTLQSVEFLILGIAMAVLVLALRRAWSPSLLNDASSAAGLLAATGFMLQAALSAATYSAWLMNDTADFSNDPEVRGAILFSTYVMGYTFLGMASLATALWLAGLAAHHRRLNHFGPLMTAFVGSMAILLVVGTVTGFAIPTVALHLVVWLVLGVRLLRIQVD